MSEPAVKTRAKGPPPSVQRAAAKAPAGKAAGPQSGLSGLMQRAGPALGLGVQRQVEVGQPGDRFEREADAAADRVSAGQSVEPAAMSPVTPESLAQTAAAPEKIPEAMPVQKAAAAPEKMPEATPVQKAAAAPEKTPEAMPVQKAAAAPEKMPEATPVQKAEAAPEKMPEATPVQKKDSGPEEQRDSGAVQKAQAPVTERTPVQTEAAGGGAPAPAASTAASDAIASKGAGKPLDPATRGTLEGGLGADLSDVRVHDDSAARASAQALDARAFTHGSDIWLGPGASQNDTRLMAHEATHVVQQAGGIHRMVQRANGKGGAAAAGGGKTPQKSAYPPAVLVGNVVQIPKLRLPSYSRKANAVAFPLKLPADTTRPPEQRQFWASHIPDASYKGNIRDRIKEKNFKPVYSTRSNSDIYYLKPAADSRKNIIGDADALPDKLTTPTWDRSGAYHPYDVDHIKEVQLVGKTEAQDIDNMELLDSSANRSSGASIAADIDAKTTAAAHQLAGTGPGTIPKNITDLAGLRANKYIVEFEDKDATYKISGTPDKDFWSKDAVRKGEQVASLRQMTEKEIESIRGGPTRLTLMTTHGLRLRDIDHWDKGKTSYPVPNFFPAFDLETVTYDPASGGEMTGTLLPRHPPLAPQPGTKLKINREPGIDYGGTLSVGLRTLTLGGLSPVEIDELDLGPKGLIVRGVVQPTVPLLKGAALDFRLEGTEIEISKTFSGSDLSAPGPIKITGSSLTIALSRSQLKATGDVDFEIERLGHGQISGTGAFGGDAGKGFGVKGYFELDKSVFDGEARIDAGYENDEFWAKGHLAIGAGKIRGIKSASLDASYAKDKFGATGSVIPDIPAVEQASLSVDYDPNVGLKFAGDLALKADTPGIGAGRLHVEAFEPAGSDHFKVSAKGSAKPKIPGVNSDLMVTYDDGTFDASVTAAYSRGRLSGSVMVGATNRPVTDGQPSGPAQEKAQDITVYGGGSLTITIGALQGTAAVHLLPNGEIEVAGEIDLTTNNFPPEKKFDKNIFTLHIDIPIFGITVPVVDTHIGIFATVEGGLDVNAGIGPGTLTGKLGIDYNPAHEENAKLWGGARLHVPANAGLRVFVSGGIGAGIPLVDATAKLTIGAGLGLEGALDTGVQIDWSPAKGLSLDADASVYVEPKLKVSVTGSVDVVFDTWVHTFHLYHHDWDLAAFEFGSNLRFGVCFPVHYDDSKGFDLSLDKVKFQVPDIKPKEILSDVISRIV